MTVEPFEVVCVDNKKIPPEIPKHLHPQLGDKYTCCVIAYLRSSKIIGLEIAELPLTEDISDPYLYWGAHRFEPVTEGFLQAEQGIEELMRPDKLHVG